MVVTSCDCEPGDDGADGHWVEVDEADESFPLLLLMMKVISFSSSYNNNII